MRYGIGEPASDSAAPNGYTSEEDHQVTEIEKTAWTHKHKWNPERRFYGAGEGDLEGTCKVAQVNLNEYIRTKG
jgi:hypothetical protein